MVNNITWATPPQPSEWQPTGEYRLARPVQLSRYEPMPEAVLQRKYLRVTWPHEPYREKGEEIIEEKWETVPTETI